VAAFSGIVFAGAGYNVSLSNSSAVALGSGGLTTTYTAGTVAFNVILVLGANDTVTNTYTGSNLILGAPVDLHGFTLTADGSGTTALLGVVGDTTTPAAA